MPAVGLKFRGSKLYLDISVLLMVLPCSAVFPATGIQNTKMALEDNFLQLGVKWNQTLNISFIGLKKIAVSSALQTPDWHAAGCN